MFRFGSDDEDDNEIIRSVRPLPKKAVDRSALMAPDFDPDQFLTSRRHLGLEQLKTELNAHLKYLKVELVELINRDYQDFINLSTNLKDIDKDIDSCQPPLKHMEQQVLELRTYFQDVIDQLQNERKRRAELKVKKDNVNLLLNIHESITKVEDLLRINDDITTTQRKNTKGEIRLGKHIERVAVEYNQMQHLVSRGKSVSFAYVTENEPRINCIRDMLQDRLSEALLSALQQITSNAGNKIARQTLTRCLRTYALIDLTHLAESLIRKEFVRPTLKKMLKTGINDKYTLSAIYDQILAYATDGLQPLRDITQDELKGTNYNILVNVLWAESAEQINQDYNEIFAAGNADLIHKNYSTSMAFISGLEALCSSKKTLLSLRTHPSYTEFMKRWQLPVYFQLRFWEIVNDLEALLSNQTSSLIIDAASNSHNTTEILLPGTKAISEAIDKCWSDKIFLYSLTHQFWKMTLQLIQRYNVWASEVMEVILAPSDEEMPNKSPTTKETADQMTALQQLIILAHDAYQFIELTKEKFERTIVPKLPSTVQDLPLLRQCLESALQNIDACMSSPLDQKVADIISQQCIETFKQVRSITNQYRHTNKSPPTGPSHFIPKVFKPFQTVLDQNPDLIEANRRATWGTMIGDTVIQQYTETAIDYLTSLKKMEDAMGAKKNKTFSTNQNVKKGDFTDEEKMRLQFLLDARQLGKELARLNVDKENLASYQKLMEVVQPFEQIETLAKNMHGRKKLNE